MELFFLLRNSPVIKGGVILVGVILVFAGLYFVLSNPKHGVVSLTVITENGATNAMEMTLENFSTSLVPIPTSIKNATLLAAVVSPDMNKRAMLYRKRDGERGIVIEQGGRVQELALPKGIPDTPQWSKDSTSIAFSEINATTSSTITNPDTWTVVRAVPSGDSLIVGHGYRPYSSPGQRTFALTSRGIELLSYQDQSSRIVVKSPTPVSITTPFAVSQDGMRIAWVAPADNSLQVFENMNGYFVPLLLQKKVHPHSIVFSPDGKYILSAEQNASTTSLYIVKVQGGSIITLKDVPGIVKLNAWRYEK